MNALRNRLQSTIGSLRTGVIAAILALGSLGAAAQTVAPLFTPPPAGDIAGAGVRAAAKRAADRPYIARQRAVGVDLQQLQPQAGRNQLALSVDLFDGVALLADLDRVDVRSAKSYSWFGRVRGLPNSRATLTVVDGVLAGNLIVLDDWNRVKGSYQVQSAGDGLYFLEEINPNAFPADHPPGIDPHPPIPRVAADAPSLRDTPKADTLATIDVLVVYSNEVASAAGSAIGAQIQVAVDAANTAYANSGINARLRLVHYAAANYAQNGNFSTDLNRLTGGGDGYMDDVHALRDAYGADMVSLWVEGGSYCGIGWVGPYASYAFTVVARGCATGNLTFAHELGHNMGALHDAYVDAGTSPYAYGHGHINLVARWRTVMSYNDLCAATPPGTSCTRIPYFSNPSLTYNGAALGTVEAGSTPTANNARVHNNGAASVAAFRPTVVGTPCTYTVSPTTASPTAAGGTATATVTTQSGCTWTASSSATWLTISSGASGTGSGTVTYATAANTGAARSATLTVGGKTVTVNQAAGCSFALSPASGSLAAAAGSGSVTVTAGTGCTWTASSSASWLTVTSGASGTGSGTVGYSATANTGPTRSANLTIGGQTFMVTQANGCTYVASPTSVSPTASATTGSVTVTAGTGCTWTASSSVSWLTVTSGASGSGNGSVGYSVAANTGAARSATLTVGGKTVSVNQAALSCNYTFAPTSASLNAAAGSSSVAVTVPTGCTWSASSSASWLTVISGNSGNGNGTVGFAATANTGPARNASLTIGGQTYAVTQANGCTYVASPTSASAAAGSGSGSVAVTAGTGCTWSASSSASWLTVTSGASGSGNGSVGYSVAANTGAARSATLTVGGKTVSVNQAALSCNYTFAPTSASLNAAAGSSSVAVTVPTGCTWSASSSASWLTVISGNSGNGNGTVGFAATANTGPARNASLTIGGQTYAVTQANGCTYVASPTSASAAAGSGSGSVAVTAGTGCTWSASSSASWLTVTSGASGSGNGSVGYSVAANTGAARSATLTVGGKTVTVNQAALSCNYTFAPTSASFTAAAGSSSVAVTVPTGCTWTATSSASWLTVTSGASGNGNGTVGFAATANTGPARSASLTIGGQTYAVTQANGCTYVASPTSVSAATGSGSGSVAVTAGTGCTWSASSSASWLTVTSGASGSGNGSVGYSVAANTGAARSATLTVGGKTVSVAQDAFVVAAPPPTGTNVALASAGAVASASSTHSAGFAVTAVNNGERAGVGPGAGGYWNDGTQGVFPDWVQIDFNGAKTIDRVVVYTLQDNFAAPVEPTDSQTFTLYGIADFSVQAWNGSGWTTLGTVTGNNLVKRSISFAPFTTSRIRVSIAAVARGGPWSRITEVEAWGSDAVAALPNASNVALASTGALASASSTHSAGFAVTAVNNGERAGVNPGAGGYWNDGTQGVFPDWIQIDFNGVKTIDRVVVYTLQDNFAAPVEPTDSQTFTLYGIADFSVQAWNGSGWTTLGTVTGNNLVKRSISFAPFTTSRIRVSIAAVARGGPWSRITEVEAWGL